MGHYGSKVCVMDAVRSVALISLREAGEMTRVRLYCSLSAHALAHVPFGAWLDRCANSFIPFDYDFISRPTWDCAHCTDTVQGAVRFLFHKLWPPVRQLWPPNDVPQKPLYIQFHQWPDGIHEFIRHQRG